MKNKDNIDKMLEEKDLEEAIQDGKLLKPKGRPKIGRKISITLPEKLILELTKAGEERGIGYQTMARVILVEKTKEYVKK